MQLAYTILNTLILLYYLVVITATRNMSTSNIITDSTVSTPVILNDTLQQKGATGSMNDGEHVYSTTAHANKAADSSLDHTVENDRTRLDVSVSEFDKGTEDADSEINNIHSSFNLAVIPAVAVLVFVVITCIKCCEWFRKYSRGGSNDEKYYAVTIHDGEDDYDHIDIVSDSTSVAYYDTVSSFSSFLKRSGNDSTVNSLRALRLHDNRNVQWSPPQGLKPLNMRYDTKENTISESEIGGKDESQVIYDARTSSTSSTDTAGDQPIFRRSNKFRVSFVAQNPNKVSEIEHKLANSVNVNDKAIRSSLKGSSCLEMKAADSTIQDVRRIGRKTGKTLMVDVGTQTNKSFRYGLRNTKRHASDTDVEERLISNAIPLMVTRENERDLDVSCVENQVTQHPRTTHDEPYRGYSTFNIDTSTPRTGHHSRSQLRGKCSIVNDIRDRAPLETNVEIIHNSHQSRGVDIELDDDVFVEDITTYCIPHNNVDSCSIANTCDKSSKTKIENCTTAISDTCITATSDNCIKLTSDTSMKTQNIEDHGQSVLYICSHCKTIITYDITKQLGDTVGDTIFSALCEKCTLLHINEDKTVCGTPGKKRASSITVQDTTTSLLNKNNETRSSLLSLESSGYAELSSSDSA